MLFELLPNGVYCSCIISSMDKSICLDPHGKPIQVRNTLNYIDCHGGHFCTFHRQREQAYSEWYIHQFQPP